MNIRKAVVSYPGIIFWLQKIFAKFGISVIKIQRHQISEDSINLNIGSSDYSIPGFVNLDMPSEWYGKTQSRNNFVPFDATKNKLPFPSGAVDNVYLSHVIEHLPRRVVEDLLLESVRVLKIGGVIRICTPDAKFLWDISKFGNSSWTRFVIDFLKDLSSKNVVPDAYDYLTFELASWSRFHGHSEKSDLEETHQRISNLSFEDCMNLITADISYDRTRPGRHVTWWSVNRIREMLEPHFGSSIHIVNSKFQGSVSPSMIGTYFDRTVPFLSLYVEIVKLEESTSA